MSEKNDFVYTTGRRQAAHLHLPGCEWDDCAAGFRLFMLTKYPDHEMLAQLCNMAPAFVVHCARQYALDYQRKLYRRREWLWSQAAEAQGETDEYDTPDPYNAVEALLCHIAFQQQLTKASAELSAVNLSYLRRRFCDQELYAEIASASGKNVNAVEQSVSRALKQLRLAFQQQSKEDEEHVDICPPLRAAHFQRRMMLSSIRKHFHFFLLYLSGLAMEQR